MPDGLTDGDILARLRDGSLQVCPFTGAAWSHGKRLAAVPNSRRQYWFYEVWKDGRRKKIARHKLAWMAHHDRAVPDGHELDHVAGKRRPHPDSVWNLNLVTKDSHDAKHGRSKQTGDR